LTEARETIEHLHVALNSCRRIGIAIGILMATRKVTEDAAFELPRSASLSTHRKLRAVADEVAHRDHLKSLRALPYSVIKSWKIEQPTACQWRTSTSPNSVTTTSACHGWHM
jgi:hypothetical protein